MNTESAIPLTTDTAYQKTDEAGVIWEITPGPENCPECDSRSVVGMIIDSQIYRKTGIVTESAALQYDVRMPCPFMPGQYYVFQDVVSSPTKDAK